MKVISVKTMRGLDQTTIESGTPGRVLMERAGRGLFEELMVFVERLSPLHRKRVALIAGKGNNGGDAYAAAGLLGRETNLPSTVYALCDASELTDDARYFAENLPDSVSVIVCREELPEPALQPGTVLVDGILGTGIAGPLRPPYDRFINQINQSALPVVAIDIPSGLNGDTGEIATEAVQADLTVTMALPKKGLITTTGFKTCGMLRCVDIGVPATYVGAAPECGRAILAEDVRGVLTRRPPDAHKNIFGHVLIVGGSKVYTGAPVMAGTAALKSGCGLATLAIPATARPLVAAHPQALILHSIPDDGSGFFCTAGKDDLEAVVKRANVVALGPGIGLADTTLPVVEQVLSWDLPVVIDADALRMLGNKPDLLPRSATTVLTPHPGEMRALLHGFDMLHLRDSSREEQALALAAKAGSYVLLKGLGTVIAAPDGRCAYNTSGTNALASGGTGDVLTGLLAGILAQRVSPWTAVCTAAFVHGRAAELSAVGKRSLTADDLVGLIGQAYRDLTPFA